MVKRPKSPDIIEDARYFTVCQPFPLNANWVFEQDQRDCATWIAECIGLEHLYAIHHKPSARGMILLEVSKLFTEHERLLGEHRWSEILTAPDDEQKNRVTQVFHSFYSKGREAQKDGWKVLGVKSSWFKNWVPGSDTRFTRPYPRTHWCPIPVEDQTNKHLCRPLPVDKMPPPPRVEPPVVGSTKWTQKKIAGQPTVEALKISWDEDISSTEAANKLNEGAQAKPNAGSILNEKNPTSTPSSDTATSVPNKGQPTSNLDPLGKNKKNNKPVPLNQFISTGEGDKKSKPATWNKIPPVPSISLSPAALNGPVVPKPTPRPANAWENPIKFKVPIAPEAKKEIAPLEDYSVWGQEAAAVQENIWTSPLPSKKKKGKGLGAASETPTASTSPGSTQPSSPQVRNIPALSSSSFTRDVPPHMIFRPSEEDEEDSDYDDIYVPFSGMKIVANNVAVEGMEYTDVNASERGGADAVVDSETSDARAHAEEGRKYQNLWSSEDDPRAVPLPDPNLICPTHHIACKKGICADMSKILRDMKKAQLKAEWEEKQKNRGRKKKGASRSGDNNAEKSAAEVDGDNYAIVGPKANRGRLGKQKKNQDGPEVDGPSFTGRLRAFTPDAEVSDHGEASGSGSKGDAPEPERQLFSEW